MVQSIGTRKNKNKAVIRVKLSEIISICDYESVSGTRVISLSEAENRNTFQRDRCVCLCCGEIRVLFTDVRTKDIFSCSCCCFPCLCPNVQAKRNYNWWRRVALFQGVRLHVSLEVANAVPLKESWVFLHLGITWKYHGESSQVSMRRPELQKLRKFTRGEINFAIQSVILDKSQ
jgi:hypothetical protein